MWTAGDLGSSPHLGSPACGCTRAPAPPLHLGSSDQRQIGSASLYQEPMGSHDISVPTTHVHFVRVATMRPEPKECPEADEARDEAENTG
mmetsp:Transcript_52471/g.118150  ORF Transcript_52471/g.118150 Transcript_52471/m.118150 type:complete len:90 (-) Transcript_52471:23-292(-)